MATCAEFGHFNIIFTPHSKDEIVRYE
jgi:hypothetical protein